nr:toll/interleukin-1 receptor-like protein isoform X2 [Malus domestica]
MIMDSTTNEGASSSSSSSYTHSWTYDVFLSFRGEDTRNNFVGHLYNNLVRKGIKTFIDDEALKRGEEISAALLKAIEQSRVSVVVFSENYASSEWCLDELVHIFHCKEQLQQMVFPVFYKVDPSDVRNQTKSLGKALAHHESKLKDNMDKVLRWRETLTKAANLSGWSFLADGPEYKFIQKIIEDISVQVLDSTHLNVAKYPVGIQSRVKQSSSVFLDLGSAPVLDREQFERDRDRDRSPSKAQDFRQPKTQISSKMSLRKKFEIVCKFLTVLYYIIIVVLVARHHDFFREIFIESIINLPKVV